MIKFTPPDVANTCTKCITCGAVFPVPLARSFSHSLAPVIPKDFDANNNNKFWQLQSVEVPCPKCNAKTLLKLPTESERGKVFLYGDDAARQSDNINVFCFSLVGGSRPFVEEIGRRIYSLKRQHEPNIDPAAWCLHMKELHSGQHRERHSVFRSWSRAKSDSFVSDVSNLLTESSKDLFTFSTSFSTSRRTTIKNLKRDCYLALSADVIHTFSQKGFTPLLHFDSEKEFTGLGPIIHGWAREAFQGAQRNLIYSYISHGLPIPEPQFLQPASHPCLELADFVSFVVARGHHCKMKGKPFDYPSEILGEVFYSWLRKDGHYGRDRRVGFPWEQVYD